MIRLGLPITVLLILPISAVAQPTDDTCPPYLGNVHTVVIDPGHGGSNEGAVGVAGIYERFLTMDAAKRLQYRFGVCFPDVRVVLTRHHDVDVGLSERTHIANLQQADLFISLHYNAAENRTAEGIEVFYLSTDEPELEPISSDDSLIGPQGTVVASILHDLDRTRDHRLSAELANDLLRALVESTGAVDRGVRQAGFRVLRGALMPAVVVELGFLTHPQEGRRLVDPAYTDTLIDALLVGIAEFSASNSRI